MHTKHGLEILLDEVKKTGNEKKREELFTGGACHAFAFAKALSLNGKAVLMTHIDIPSKGLDSLVHAWCEAGNRVIDFYGGAQSVGLLLQRFMQRKYTPGTTVIYEPGARPASPVSFSTVEIDLVLAGGRTLPTQFYQTSAFLSGAVDEARRIDSNSS